MLRILFSEWNLSCVKNHKIKRFMTSFRWTTTVLGFNYDLTAPRQSGSSKPLANGSHAHREPALQGLKHHEHAGGIFQLVMAGERRQRQIVEM